MPQLPWTDAMRGLACVTVIVWHVVHSFIYEETLPFKTVWTLPLAATAREAVLIFIVLSGYLLGRHWNARSPVRQVYRTYLIRRSWRILPPYLVALVVTVLVMLFLGLDEGSGTPWDAGLPLTWLRALASFALVTDVLGWVPLSHPLWTVPVEYHLYFLAPIVVLAATRIRVAALGVVLFLVASLLLPYPAPYFPIAFVLSFWVGLRRQRSNVWNRKEAWTAALPGLLVLVPVAVIAFATSASTDSIRNYMFLDALIAPVLVVWMYRADLTASRELLVRILQWRPFVWVGQRSYSIYLFHAIVLELVWRHVFDGRSGWAALLLCLGLSIVLSIIAGAITYRLVELPTANKSARIGKAAIARQRRKEGPTGERSEYPEPTP